MSFWKLSQIRNMKGLSVGQMNLHNHVSINIHKMCGIWFLCCLKCCFFPTAYENAKKKKAKCVLHN